MKSMVTPLTRVLPFRHPNGHNTLPFSITRYPSSPNSSFSPLTLTLSMAASPQSSAAAVSPGNVNIDKDGVFQLIQAHQEKAARLPPVEEIRTVLDRSVRGMLSTFSKKFDGYPSGSMVDFACDANGYPILAVSDLAVHSKDLTANPKCSLLVARDPEDRTDLVITLHGDAISVPENDKEAVRAAYLARHPNAFWVDFGDFRFLRIEPKVVRFVSGVATALLGSGEFSRDEYKSAKVDPIAQFSKPVVSHMNKDHAEDNKVIVQHWTSVPVDFAYMLDLDSLGFNVKAGYGMEEATVQRKGVHLKKRALKNKALGITFNEKDLKDYVTGFHKRKKKRRKEAQKQQNEALRRKRNEERKKRKLERQLVLNGGVPPDEIDEDQEVAEPVESIAETKTYENDDLKVTVVTREINPEEESYPGERKEASVTPHSVMADKRQGVPITNRKSFKKVAQQRSRPKPKSNRHKKKGKKPGKK